MYRQLLGHSKTHWKFLWNGCGFFKVFCGLLNKKNKPVYPSLQIRLRKLLKKDKRRLNYMLEKAGVFKKIERRVALDLINFYLKHPKQKEYYFECAVDTKDRLVGYVCYGSAPLSSGTTEIYWLLVDPDYQGLGVGSRLIRKVEQKSRARIILVETSSLPRYERTRRFYKRKGYIQVSRIKDYYSRGDDLIVYKKSRGV